jgi:hypothetical protein
MFLFEYIALRLLLDIDEHHILRWKHDSGGTEDSDTVC